MSKCTDCGSNSQKKKKKAGLDDKLDTILGICARKMVYLCNTNLSTDGAFAVPDYIQSVDMFYSLNQLYID